MTSPIAAVFATLDDTQPQANASIRAYGQLAWFAATHRAASTLGGNHTNPVNEVYAYEPASGNAYGYAPPALAAIHAATVVANTNKADHHTQITASIIAASLIVALNTDKRLSDLASAIVCGHDVAARTLATLTNHTDYDITYAACVLGALTAATLLTTKNHDVRQHAYGIASTQIARLLNAHGDTPARITADATDTAVEAALLATHGFTGPVSGIDGRRGSFTVIAPTADLGLLTTAAATSCGVSYDGADTINEAVTAVAFYTSHLT